MTQRQEMRPQDRPAWTKEEFIDKIVRPLRSGTPITQLSRDLKLSRQRIHAILLQFGFKGKKELLRDVNYQ